MKTQWAGFCRNALQVELALCKARSARIRK